jgi:hypothetical protein
MTTPDQKPRLRWGVRFSPHVLPFLATIGLTWIPFSSAIVSGVFWWWGPTYQQVTFVMDEAHANDGYPYIDGRLDGATEVTRISGMMVGDQIAPEDAPGETFVPGRRILIWHSPSAPDFGVEGRSINEFSVAAHPTLPGLGSLLDALAMTALIIVAGLCVTVWVYKRFARRWGELDIRGTGRSTRAS